MIYYSSAPAMIWMSPFWAGMGLGTLGGAVGGGTFGPVVRAAGGGTLSAATTPTLPTALAGDTIVLFLYVIKADGLPTTPSGWTLQESSQVGPTCYFYTFTKVATGSDSFVSGNALTALYTTYSLYNVAVGYDGDSVGTGTSSPIICGPIQPTGINDVVFYNWCAVGTNPTVTGTIPSYFTAQEQNQGTQCMATGYFKAVSTGFTNVVSLAAGPGLIENIGTAIAIK